MKLGAPIDLSPEELASIGAIPPGPTSAQSAVVMPPRSPAASVPRLATPIDQLDDFDVFNAMEDAKEARGYDPADPGIASMLWNGVKGLVGTIPGIASAGITLIRSGQGGTGGMEAAALMTETGGKVLGNYNVIGAGIKALKTKADAELVSVLDPNLKQEMKTLSRRASWEFFREARDTETFTRDFNQHLETIFPNALAGFSSIPVDKEASTGLAQIMDPANFVPAAAAAKWFTKVPLRGAVRAAESVVKEAALDAAKAQAARESVALALKPSLSGEARETARKAILEAGDKWRDAQSRLAQARETLVKTASEQRALVDQLATEAAEQPMLTRAAATTAQGLGAGMELAGQGLQRLAEAPTKIASMVASGASEGARAGISEGIRNTAGLMGILPAAAGASGTALSSAGRNLSVYGRVLSEAEGTLPFFKRLARETDGLTSFGASLVDQSGLGAVIVPAARIAAESSRGVPFSALMGYVSSGGDINAAAETAGGGMVFGMAGAGYGQWRRYSSGALFRQQQLGDIARYRNTLATDEVRKHFDQLPGADRAAMATMQLAHPDLKVKYEKLGEGRPSFYYAAEDGPVAVVNLDSKDGIRAVLSHEIGHHVERHGVGPVVDQILFGDPLLQRPGMFTAIGKDGLPVIDHSGAYTRNAEWGRISDSYNERLKAHAARTGEPALPRSASDMGREIFAEHVADYLRGDNGALRRDLRSDVWSRAIDSIADSSLVGSMPMLRQALGKLGVPLSMEGKRVSGSELFPGGLPASRDLQRIIRKYHQESASGTASKIDAEPGNTRYTAAEVVAYPEILDKLFDGTDDVARDGKGRVLRNKDGSPRFLTTKEQKQLRTEQAKLIEQEIEKATPPGARFEETKQDGQGWAVPGLPDPLIDNLEASGKFAPAQITHLRMVSGMIRDGGGKSAMFFYQPALTSGKQYASLAGDWRTETPYQIFVSKAGNVLFRTMSREKLMTNAQEMVAKKRAALWDNSLPSLVSDIDRYLANHASGKSGAEGIGIQKRDQINSLFGIGTKANISFNPFLETSPKAPVVIRSRRLDRTNRLTPVEEQFQTNYDLLNRNFRPESADINSGGEAQKRAHPITSFVDDVLASTDNSKKVFSIAPVDPEMAKRLNSVTGGSLEGYTHALDNSAVRHIIREHGNARKESSRGQIAITIDDFERIPEIIASPDRIENPGKTKLGHDAILYIKQFDDVVHYFEEIRTGRKQLAAVTMYKKRPGTPDARP